MGKTKRDSKLKISKDVIFTQLDKDDGILLNLNTKNYYSLNETACIILKSIKNGESRQELIRRLTNRFDVPIKKVRKDLKNTIRYFRKEKIIT